MTTKLHEAIKNSKGISKLTNLVGGEFEKVVFATEAIINKNMKNLSEEEKERSINDKVYIENQIVGIIEALKGGSTIYSKFYEKTKKIEFDVKEFDLDEFTRKDYENDLEFEEKIEKAEKEFYEDLNTNEELCNTLSKIIDELEELENKFYKIINNNSYISNKINTLEEILSDKEKYKKDSKTKKEIIEKMKKLFNEIKKDIEKENIKTNNNSNNNEKENIKTNNNSNKKEETKKDKKKKGFLDYVVAPFKYVGEKIGKAASFIGEKISNGFNKLKGLFGKKETKETVK